MTTISMQDAIAACATEPIHIPGAIQPHGHLFVVDRETFEIIQASEAAWALVGVDVEAVRAAPTPPRVPLSRLSDAVVRGMRTALTYGDLARPYPVGCFDVAGLGKFDTLLHAYDGVLFVELEPAIADPPPYFTAMHSLVRTFVAQLQGVTSVDDLCRLAATEMHRITRFGRTLVYRFNEEGHGEVLAQHIEPGYDSYLGHWFPASDIPAQARELYRKNHLRIIGDANYAAVPLVPTLNPLSGKPTDLTYAALRSVSPVHLEYLRNMGTLASMSISIVVENKLWGLISCHHATPKQSPFTVRLAAEHLGQVLSLQIEAREGHQDIEYGLELRRILVSLVATAAEGTGALQRLTDAPDLLLRIAGATGAAVVVAGECRLVGETPTEAQILALVDWLAARGSDVVATNCLPQQYPPAGEFCDRASGLLAISVSQLHRDAVLWFRPEVVQNILWAGNPNKPASVQPDAMQRLHPRRSFETWREEVHGQATPWRNSEIAVAADLRHALLNIVLRRAEEVAALANELGRINKELEAFSYSVSHDLRAPLRHITGYADLLREGEGAGMSDRSRRFLANIKDSAQFAGTLVDDLLGFSQMGRAAIRPARIDLGMLTRGIVANMRHDGSATGVEWRIGSLPTVVADPVFMQVVMQNLIGNAVKYSQGRTPPIVTIDGTSDDDGATVRVMDNGVGFDMRYAGKLFGVFQRLHSVEEFAGTGIGLASVRRAIERQGGTVTAYGELGTGATFTFMLPHGASRVDADDDAPDPASLLRRRAATTDTPR